MVVFFWVSKDQHENKDRTISIHSPGFGSSQTELTFVQIQKTTTLVHLPYCQRQLKEKFCAALLPIPNVNRRLVDFQNLLHNG